MKYSVQLFFATMVGCFLLFGAMAYGQDTSGGDAALREILALKDAKKYDAALEATQKALRTDYRHNAYLFQAADICTKKKDYKQAVRYFALLTRYYPDIPFNWGFAGINAYLDSDYDTAEKYLRRALRWNPEQLTPALHEQARVFLAAIKGGTTYKVVWELQPKPSLLENGRIRIPLPTSEVPYQQLVSHSLTGARSYVENTEPTGNKVLLVEPEGMNKFVLTAIVTCKSYSLRSFAEKAIGGESPSALATYLKTSFMANTDGVRVAKIAAELKSTNPIATIRNIVMWLDANIYYQLIGFNSVDQILDRGYVACEGYSALFCALCRACGIPAREVWGVCWPNPETGRLNGHGWSEVYLNGIGWCPVDATPSSRADMAGPDHIRMGHYSTVAEFRLWRNLIEMNTGPSTTATTPFYELVSPPATP